MSTAPPGAIWCRAAILRRATVLARMSHRICAAPADALARRAASHFGTDSRLAGAHQCLRARARVGAEMRITRSDSGE